jgi:hypothetical protein
MFDLPRAIDFNQDILSHEWLEDLPEYHTPEDAHLACVSGQVIRLHVRGWVFKTGTLISFAFSDDSFSLWPIGKLLVSSAGSEVASGGDAPLSYALRAAESILLSHRRVWLETEPSRLTITSQLDNRLVSWLLLVFIRGQKLQQDITSPIANSEFLAAASGLAAAMADA